MTSSIDQNEPPANSPKSSSPTPLQIIIVCVIFMVLGAILMPFPDRQSSEAGRQSDCESHLRILGAALLQYSQDYDDNLPYGRSDSSGRGWAGRIEPYVKTDSAKGVKHEAQVEAAQASWVCPDDPTGPDRGIDPTGLAVSYSLNATLTGDNRLPNCSTKRSRLSAAERTVMLFEVRGPIVQVDLPDEGGAVKPQSGWFSPTGNGMANALQKGGAGANLDAFGVVQYETGDIGSRGCRAGACLPPRHGAKAVYLEADGHVEVESPDHVSSGNTPSASGGQTGGLADGNAASTDCLSQKSVPDRQYALTFSAK